MGERRRGFPLRYYVIAFVLIALVGLSPILAVIAADAIASAHGCTLNEGTSSVCKVMGSDWGEGLYAAFVLPWLLLATLPLAGGAVLVLLVIFIIHRLAWGRMQKVKDQ